MGRSATIYLGEDRIVLQPNDQIGQNSGHAAGSPVVTLAHDASMGEILKALERTINESKALPSIPADLKERIKPLLTATGEKTWNGVSRSFAYVGLSEQNGKFVFYAGFPEKGSFLFKEEAHWPCNPLNQQEMAIAFRSAAEVAIEAQNLANPPPLRHAGG